MVFAFVVKYYIEASSKIPQYHNRMQPPPPHPRE